MLPASAALFSDACNSFSDIFERYWNIKTINNRKH